MRIAVMSDTHDNIWNLRNALGMIRNQDAKMIIHCGDFVAPFMLSELEKAGIPVHGVFGNNDGDQYKLTTFALTILKHISLHGVVGRVDIDGFRIGFTHFEEVAEGLACSGRYDMVCFGHSHKFFHKKIAETLLLNPGEVMGKEGHPGYCLVDTETAEVQQCFLFE